MDREGLDLEGIAQRVRAAIATQGTTQHKLADATQGGVSRKTVERIVAGQAVSATSYAAVADALGMSYEDVVGQPLDGPSPLERIEAKLDAVLETLAAAGLGPGGDAKRSLATLARSGSAPRKGSKGRAAGSR